MWHAPARELIGAADALAEMGALRLPRRSSTGARARSRCSATPRIRCCPISRKAPPWRSRTRPCWRNAWRRRPTTRRRRCAATRTSASKRTARAQRAARRNGTVYHMGGAEAFLRSAGAARHARHRPAPALRLALWLEAGVSRAYIWREPSPSDSIPMDHHVHSEGSPPAATGAIDPVCGMTVDPHTTPHRHTHHGRPYYFCSAGCRTKFAADPAKYLSPASDKAPSRCRRARSTPARCIRRCARSGPAPARSAAWRSSRRSPPRTPDPIPSSPT